MKLAKNKNIYFASDQHFGAPTREASKVRETVFLKWLNHIQNDAAALFLVGDLFVKLSNMFILPPVLSTFITGKQYS